MKNEKLAIKALFAKDRGRLSINQRKVLSLLVTLGYGTVNTNSKFLKGSIVKKVRNIITEVDLIQLRKEFLSFCEDNELKERYLECLQNKIGYILSQTQVNTLKSINVNLLKDTSDCAYFPFMNKVVKVSSKKIDFLRYSEIEKNIIDKQRKPFNVSSIGVDGGDFKRFCELITNENKEWFLSLQTALGYLLLTNKEAHEDKAVIIYDHLLANRNEANGGSGKSLIIGQAIAQLKNVNIIDAKKYDSRNKFVYQNVDESTNVILFDDINRNFKFDDIYSALTVGFEIERKGKQSVFLDYREAPKFAITSNRLLRMDEGSSSERRKYELFLYNYFDAERKPESVFGKRFFSQEWDQSEYNKFFYFMFQCVQMYLVHGLIEYLPKELNEAKLEAELGTKWIDYFDRILEDFKGDVFNEDRREVEECAIENGLSFTPHSITKKFKTYCKYKGYAFELSNSGSVQKYKVTLHEVRLVDYVDEETGEVTTIEELVSNEVQTTKNMLSNE